MFGNSITRCFDSTSSVGRRSGMPFSQRVVECRRLNGSTRGPSISKTRHIYWLGGALRPIHPSCRRRSPRLDRSFSTRSIQPLHPSPRTKCARVAPPIPASILRDTSLPDASVEAQQSHLFVLEMSCPTGSTPSPANVGKGPMIETKLDGFGLVDATFLRFPEN